MFLFYLNKTKRMEMDFISSLDLEEKSNPSISDHRKGWLNREQVQPGRWRLPASETCSAFRKGEAVLWRISTHQLPFNLGSATPVPGRELRLGGR